MWGKRSQKYAPHGFSLVEVLVASALSTVVASLTLGTGIAEYDHSMRRTDEETILTTLLTARAESQNGVCGVKSCTGPSAHGVSILGTGLLLFEGADLLTRNRALDRTIPLFGADAVTLDSEAVLFAPYSAEVAAPATFTIIRTDGSRHSVHIGTEGQIQQS